MFDPIQHPIDAWTMDTNTPTALQTAHRHHKHPHGWISIDTTSALALTRAAQLYGGRTSMAMVPLHRRSMWPAGVCCKREDVDRHS